MIAPTCVFARQTGLSYAEVLLAVTVLAVVLVPALETLQTAMVGAQVHENVATTVNDLASRMEMLLAEPHSDLDAAALAAGSTTIPSIYSDPAGPPERILVFLSRYDGDNADADGDPFTGMDEGLLWVRVAVENTPFELITLTAR